MRAGSDAHDMTNSPWYEPLGVLYSKKYHMYASGGFYALSSEAVQLLTQIPMSQRRLAGGGDDTSVGLWVLGYNIPYLDDRRLAGYVEKGWTTCPDDFIGEHYHNRCHCTLWPTVGPPAVAHYCPLFPPPCCSPLSGPLAVHHICKT